MDPLEVLLCSRGDVRGRRPDSVPDHQAAEESYARRLIETRNLLTIMKPMNTRLFRLSCALLLTLASSLTVLAQQKLLTIDDIFDPAKKVNFNGTTPTVRWLKDGNHYLVTNEASRTDVPRLQKVNAATGQATPFFDAAKMQAAFAALPGVSAADARQLAGRGNYNLNPAETAVLINWANDLFYYELGSDRAIRLRSEEHTSELQSQSNLVCRLLLEKKKKKNINIYHE